MNKKFLTTALISTIFTVSSIFAQVPGNMESTSSINWITRKFVSKISLDTEKAKIQMPSGKKLASGYIKTRMPQLIQPPLLSLFVDSARSLGDYVFSEQVTTDQIYNFILSGYKTPDVFTNYTKKLNTTNTLNVNDIGKTLVKHKYEYTPEEPIDSVPSRAYTGIIIDARGKYSVHGEYVKDNVYGCFFPKIWDENMNIIYEKSMVNADVVKNKGLVAFDFSDDATRYEDRVGADPLYIKTMEVFGRNRTDPIIRRNDALKILSVPENIELLKQGKVVILLDKDRLVYNIATPEKNEEYYVKYETVKKYIFETAIPGVDFTNDKDGFKFSAHLNFYPDSAKLLPGEEIKIKMIADQLKDVILNDGYTILVEGHTADVGKPVGQLNLSIERTKTVTEALISFGIDRSIFTTKGCGGTVPIASNETEEGRKLNRRVEIIARPRATYIERDW